MKGLVLQKDAEITHRTVGSFATELCQRLAQHSNLRLSFSQSYSMCCLGLL